MRIAVTTPTGHVGRHVVTGLLRAGVRPLVLARDPGRLDPGVRATVDVVAVDQGDAAAVERATRGVDALHWIDPTPPDRPTDHERVRTALLGAVTANRIGRVVFQSSVGAEIRHGAGDIDALAATEVALDATGADVCHLRCGYFHTNLTLQLAAVRAGVLQVLLPLDQPLPWVAPRDIAEVSVGRLLSTTWSGRVVQAVHGPADLTWSQVAAIVTAATGHPVRSERIADDDLRAALRSAGMPDDQVEGITRMSTGLRDGFVPEQPRTVATTTPTSLAGWAYDELRPLLR